MIMKIMAAETDPQNAAEAIVQAATDGGSKDNITGVCVFIDQA